MKNLNHYIYAFTTLRRGNANAPHKPILLLALINLYEANLLTNNHIFITAELVAFFRDNWLALVQTPHTQRFTLPFFHLSNEKTHFWQLIPRAGCEIWITSKAAMRSFENLKTAVAYAQIDPELHLLLLQKQTRDILKTTLLETYFPNSKNNIIGTVGGNYTNQIKQQILTESGNEYAKNVQLLRNTLDTDEYQKEIFVRSGFFKRIIPEIYQNTCCISGLRIDATTEASLIDACHIVPFSISQNDTISNGLSLCPNLHRAFDRGLISINQHYEIIISPCFTEKNESPYSIMQFRGKKITLPEQPEHLPSTENLWWHQKKVFKS